MTNQQNQGKQGQARNPASKQNKQGNKPGASDQSSNPKQSQFKNQND